MSSSADTHANAPDDGALVHGSEHGPIDLPHASLRGYLIGFVLSVILTIIPFWLVMGGVINSAVATAIIIIILGVIQIFVHLVYFLHLNSRSEDGWNLMALLFSLILVVAVLLGSVWIMMASWYHMMDMDTMMHAGKQQVPSMEKTIPGYNLDQSGKSKMHMKTGGAGQ